VLIIANQQFFGRDFGRVDKRSADLELRGGIQGTKSTVRFENRVYTKKKTYVSVGGSKIVSKP